MRRLVEVGSWDAVDADVAPLLTRPLRNFQATIRRDGIRKVDGPGVLRHDCPANPRVNATSDCFAYRLSGVQAVPTQGATKLEARYRLWLHHEDGRWVVVSYDYDLIPS